MGSYNQKRIGEIYHVRRLKNHRSKISDFPLNVAIEPSNYCNLNCIMCANDRMTRPKGTMDILLYKKIIDEISEENPYTRIWLDYYGEPLLQRFRLYYFIDYAKKKGLKNICINTNGTLLDKEMAEMLLDSGINFISIDCDGFSAEVYEKIRIRAKRDVLYKNIEYLLERRKSCGGADDHYRGKGHGNGRKQARAAADYGLLAC